MITFTPPIRASLLVTTVYLICFQLFLYSGHMVWMLPANIFFILCCMKYVSFLTNKSRRYLNMLVLIEKGMTWSLITSVISFASAVILLLVYSRASFAAPHVSHALIDMTTIRVLLFSNGLIANFVSGSLAVFLIAGIKNEKNYSPRTKHLPSVKDLNRML